MADVFRYRYGNTSPIDLSVTSAQGASIGDMLAHSTGYAYRPDQESFTSLSAAQYGFATRFAGVAAQRKPINVGRATGAGKDNKMRVDTEGVFEFDCFATAHEVGDLVGAAGNSTGSALENQKVEGVSTDTARAIGRVAETKAASLTKVKVRIFSKLMLGGPQS